MSDHAVDVDAAAEADLGADADHHAGADHAALADDRAGVDNRRGVHARPRSRRWVEGLRHLRVAAIGPPGEQKLHAGRRALGKLRRDDAGAGLAFGELAEVAPVVEKADVVRSEEHTSELQSLMRISYAVFCLKKKKI